jgi:hypothetical protein
VYKKISLRGFKNLRRDKLDGQQAKSGFPLCFDVFFDSDVTAMYLIRYLPFNGGYLRQTVFYHHPAFFRAVEQGADVTFYFYSGRFFIQRLAFLEVRFQERVKS